MANVKSQALYYECFSGISGDMHIGAMVDLGVPAEWLRTQLDTLPVADEFELELVADKRKGIGGTRASVKLKPGIKKPHRHLPQIEQIIRATGLPTTVVDHALEIFRHIAVAEAAIHQIPIEKVHFHEVGATDSIVDILAAALCLDYLRRELGVTQIFCNEVEVGSGTVRCEHGLMPVPAPATALILQGVPCHYGRVDGEATTPTGAAILRASVDTFVSPQRFVVNQQGLGVGQKDFAVANILRVSIGETDAPRVEQSDADFGYLQETNIELECNLDDMQGEAFQPLLDALWQVPVLDAFITPIQMKKNRPGHKLTLLCSEEHLSGAMGVVFDYSTTLGVRTREVHKWMLPREHHQIQTSLGVVPVKVTTTATGQRRWKIEHDAILSLATTAVPYPETARRLQLEVAAALNPSSDKSNS